MRIGGVQDDKPRLSLFDKVGPSTIETIKQTPVKIRTCKRKSKFKLHREKNYDNYRTGIVPDEDHKGIFMLSQFNKNDTDSEQHAKDIEAYMSQESIVDKFNPNIVNCDGSV